MIGSGCGGLDQDKRQKVSADRRRWTQMKNGQNQFTGGGGAGNPVHPFILRILIRSYFFQ